MEPSLTGPPTTKVDSEIVDLVKRTQALRFKLTPEEDDPEEDATKENKLDRHAEAFFQVKRQSQPKADVVHSRTDLDQCTAELEKLVKKSQLIRAKLEAKELFEDAEVVTVAGVFNKALSDFVFNSKLAGWVAETSIEGVVNEDIIDLVKRTKELREKLTAKDDDINAHEVVMVKVNNKPAIINVRLARIVKRSKVLREKIGLQEDVDALVKRSRVLREKIALQEDIDMLVERSKAVREKLTVKEDEGPEVVSGKLVGTLVSGLMERVKVLEKKGEEDRARIAMLEEEVKGARKSAWA